MWKRRKITKEKLKNAKMNEGKKVVITNTISGKWHQGNVASEIPAQVHFLSGEWHQGGVE